MTDLQTEGGVATPAETTASLTGPAPQEAIHHRATWRDRTRSVIKHILLIAASVIMIYPLLWLMASSLRPTEVIFRTPGLWLNDLYVENYTKGWYALSYPFGQYIINSAIVVIGAIAGNLFACTLAAYAFARLKFRLQGAVVRHHAVDAHAALPRGRRAAVHPVQRAGLREHVRSADLA